jgi:hypothetical protein
VTSSNSRSDQDGFATPGAAVVSLALAIMVTAVMVRSTSELRRARADLERTRAEYALEGAAAAAEISILQSRPADRYAWSLSNDLGAFEVLAEAEAPKLALAKADALDDTRLAQLGVQNADALRARLLDLSTYETTAPEVASADASPAWKACGPSLVSLWGFQSAPHLAPSTEPDNAGGAVRLGEVWRIRTRSGQGLTDDRVVRFTGDSQHPAAVLARRLYQTKKGDTCDSFADVKPST